MNDHLLETALAAAESAADYIRNAALDVQSLEVEEKTRFDYVSKVDREAERLIRDCVRENCPDSEILGEEFGTSQGGSNSDLQWVIDPLDGTTNFLRGIPHFAVSIAVKRGDELVVGVVADVAKNEVFHAVVGQGAYLNGKRLPRLSRDIYDGCLLATGVPFSGKILAEVDSFTNTMTDLLARGTSGIRRLGSAALDLAYVAAGRYDGFWEASLKPWDIAAGVLLVTEVGGKVSDFKGGESFLDSGDIVAGPDAVHQEMVRTTRNRYHR